MMTTWRNRGGGDSWGLLIWVRFGTDCQKDIKGIAFSGDVWYNVGIGCSYDAQKKVIMSKINPTYNFNSFQAVAALGLQSQKICGICLM